MSRHANFEFWVKIPWAVLPFLQRENAHRERVCVCGLLEGEKAGEMER